MSISITQQEADSLFALAKHYVGQETFTFPSLGGELRIPLYSENRREEFNLSVRRSKIELRKNTFQNRVRTTIILARLDIEGKHRNPDGEEFTGSHLHLYREGFNDRWAFTIPPFFTAPSDAWKTLHEFMAYCNIVTRLEIKGDLFS